MSKKFARTQLNILSFRTSLAPQKANDNWNGTVLSGESITMASFRMRLRSSKDNGTELRSHGNHTSELKQSKRSNFGATSLLISLITSRLSHWLLEQMNLSNSGLM